MDLRVGETASLFGVSVQLVRVVAHRAEVCVGKHRAWLAVANRAGPTTVGGLRLFLADTRPLAEREAELPRSPHGLLRRDALIAAVPEDRPMLDPERFEFPIAPLPEFQWTAEEDTGLFSLCSTYGSYPGIDIDLSAVAGCRPWAVALEEGRVAATFPAGRRGRAAVLVLESLLDPGVFYVYGGLSRQSVRVKPGQRIGRGAPLAEIQTRTYWPRLFFTVQHASDPPTREEELHRNVLPAFPALWELYRGGAAWEERRWHGALFSFERFRFTAGNRRRLFAYTPVTGYGWVLGDWNPFQRLEGSLRFEWRQSLLLQRRQYRWLAEPIVNPEAHYRFRIAVGQPGRYFVQAIVGDRRTATRQTLVVGAAEWGPIELPQGRFQWSPRLPVTVREDMLEVTICLDEELPAGLGELIFYPAPVR